MRPGRAPSVLALAAALALSGCGGGGAKHLPTTSASATRPGGDADTISIYELDLRLIDQDGRALVLADLRGRVLIAAMMYSSCKSVCPRLTEDMKAIERRLGDVDRGDVGFVLFSLDPGRDTPAALRRFATEHHLDAHRWRLFAASEEGVRDLSAVLGVKSRPEESGEIAHSAMTFVIDREGVVRHRQLGLDQDPGGLVSAVERARQLAPRSSSAPGS